MSIAKILGVHDLNSPTMQEVRQRWEGWHVAEPALAVAAEVDDLVGWSWARHPDADEVLRALARLGSTEPLATTVLCWMLIPGATSIARQHSDRSSVVDDLTASCLWVAASEFDGTRAVPVAATVLRTARRALQAELGIGEGARRSDRVWAATTPWSPEATSWTTVVAHEPDEPPAVVELLDLLADATAAGVISVADRELLLDVAVATQYNEVDRGNGSPSCRRSCGLGNRAAAAAVSRRMNVSERTVRRRLRRCLDSLSEYAAKELQASSVS